MWLLGNCWSQCLSVHLGASTAAGIWPCLVYVKAQLVAKGRSLLLVGAVLLLTLLSAEVYVFSGWQCRDFMNGKYSCSLLWWDRGRNAGIPGTPLPPGQEHGKRQIFSLGRRMCLEHIWSPEESRAPMGQTLRNKTQRPAGGKSNGSFRGTV